MSSWEEDEPGLWLGCRDTEGIFLMLTSQDYLHSFLCITLLILKI
jgi:hypothetical protein